MSQVNRTERSYELVKANQKLGQVIGSSFHPATFLLLLYAYNCWVRVAVRGTAMNGERSSRTGYIIASFHWYREESLHNLDNVMNEVRVWLSTIIKEKQKQEYLNNMLYVRNAELSPA